MLTRVTITGADNETRPSDLVALSRDFPFVEWGILFSAKRAGYTRYPSWSWVQGLQEARRAAAHEVALAAHLCGQMARDTLGGDDKWVTSPFLDGFERIQLNGYAPGACRSPLAWPGEWILQVRREDQLQDAAHDAARLGRASALFDPSGGLGLEPFRWPRAPLGLKLGYAGGIKPSTVDEVLSEIGIVNEPFWIDMESGVRDAHDRFRIPLVREVLERTSKWITRAFAGAQMSERCTFRFDHDPATLTPRGRACTSQAVEEIHWKDGRTSVACKEHGVDALTDSARMLVARVVPLPLADRPDKHG